jgi:hypothetical protein
MGWVRSILLSIYLIKQRIQKMSASDERRQQMSLMEAVWLIYCHYYI